MTSCSIRNSELQAFAESNLSKEQEKTLLVHLRNCKTCQLRLGDIFEQNPLPSLQEELNYRLKKHIGALVRDSERKKQARKNGWQLINNLIQSGMPALAAANDQTADDKLTRLATETASIYFVAVCEENDSGYWRAEFPLPVEVSPESIMLIRIYNSDNEPVKNGVFSFCGIEREVENGRVRYSIKELQENLKKNMVSFRYPGCETVDGVMELFGEMED